MIGLSKHVLQIPHDNISSPCLFFLFYYYFFFDFWQLILVYRLIKGYRSSFFFSIGERHPTLGSITMHQYVVVVLLLLASVWAGADALSVELVQSKLLGVKADLSQHAVQFSNTSLCFHSVVADDQGANTIASTHCTFDSGLTFEVMDNVDDMCLRGIVVDHQLLCPREQVQQPEDGEVEYAVVAFEARDSAIHKENTERRFVFKGNKLTGVLSQVYFNGNAIYIEEDDVYLFVSTAINTAEDTKVVVFRSEDGFVYNAISVIPNLQESKQHYMIYDGGRTLSVISFNGSYYTSVSSGYAGRRWSAMMMLNVSTPPTSVVFSSGVQFQHACSNETSERAKWYVIDDKERHAIKTETPELPVVSGVTSRSPFLAFSLKVSDSDKKRLLVLQSESIDNGETNVRASVFTVDDSAEEKEKTDKIERRKKEQLKREAARFKAKLERMEQEKALQRERRRKEAERKARFITLDEPNVRAAKEFLEKDGEMILVRRVNKDSIAFEKEVFFSDL
ncbi:hypothetical protein, conserved [Leishmania tarentolae]|uniref:Uncharacterized protein n=1 Tax=Leishmania tarentolae TaxID=5689 RepID=A0A640KDU9_LEITA|nr:hypothetical protein, conserved [Leishmania tarentolae]